MQFVRHVLAAIHWKIMCYRHERLQKEVTHWMSEQHTLTDGEKAKKHEQLCKGFKRILEFLRAKQELIKLTDELVTHLLDNRKSYQCRNKQGMLIPIEKFCKNPERYDVAAFVRKGTQKQVRAFYKRVDVIYRIRDAQDKTRHEQRLLFSRVKKANFKISRMIVLLLQLGFNLLRGRSWARQYFYVQYVAFMEEGYQNTVSAFTDDLTRVQCRLHRAKEQLDALDQQKRTWAQMNSVHARIAGLPMIVATSPDSIAQTCTLSPKQETWQPSDDIAPVTISSRRRKRGAVYDSVPQDIPVHEPQPLWHVILCTDMGAIRVDIDQATPERLYEELEKELTSDFPDLRMHIVIQKLKEIMSSTPEQRLKWYRTQDAHPKGWRISRFGKFRILFDIHDANKTLHFLIRRRREAYR